MARVAITRCDRLFAIGGLVIAIMTTETAIPLFVTNVVGMRAPIGLHLGTLTRGVAQRCSGLAK